MLSELVLHNYHKVVYYRRDRRDYHKETRWDMNKSRIIFLVLLFAILSVAVIDIASCAMAGDNDGWTTSSDIDWVQTEDGNPPRSPRGPGSGGGQGGGKEDP